MATRCTCCHKPLSHPRSIEDGIGPVCRRKAFKTMNEDEHMQLAKVTTPARFTVACTRIAKGNEVQVRTNVPRSVVQHSPDGFEWGYGGSGPADLALNILNAFIPPGTDGLEPVECYKGKASATAWRLHQDFKWAFISAMPANGASINGNVIAQWIGERLNNGAGVEVSHDAA